MSCKSREADIALNRVLDGRIVVYWSTGDRPAGSTNKDLHFINYNLLCNYKYFIQLLPNIAIMHSLHFCGDEKITRSSFSILMSCLLNPFISSHLTIVSVRDFMDIVKLGRLFPSLSNNRCVMKDFNSNEITYTDVSGEVAQQKAVSNLFSDYQSIL